MGNQIVETKKVFRAIGYSLFMMITTVIAAQFILTFILSKLGLGLEQSPWRIGLLIGIPFYFVGFPIFLWMMNKIPDGPKRRVKKMPFKHIVIAFFISMSATYILNLVSILINILIGLIKGSEVINPLEMVLGTSSIIPIIIFAGILSPIVEEIVFRGVLLDKLRGYGDKRAICFTAFAFALFHGNLSQFFYAFAIGLIFGYIAIKTNTIRYTVILHITINLFGSAIMPFLALSSNESLMVLAGFIVIAFVVIGAILFNLVFKKIKLEAKESDLEIKVSRKLVYGNRGILLYYIVCLALFIHVIIT